MHRRGSQRSVDLCSGWHRLAWGRRLGSPWSWWRQVSRFWGGPLYIRCAWPFAHRCRRRRQRKFFNLRLRNQNLDGELLATRAGDGVRKHQRCTWLGFTRCAGRWQRSFWTASLHKLFSSLAVRLGLTPAMRAVLRPVAQPFRELGSADRTGSHLIMVAPGRLVREREQPSLRSQRHAR